MKEEIEKWIEEETKFLNKFSELYIYEMDKNKIKTLNYLILFHKTRILAFEQVLKLIKNAKK